jgi:uncharacterized lipoprotein YmbA
MLELYGAHAPRPSLRNPPARIGILDQIGRETRGLVAESKALDFIGDVIVAGAQALRRPGSVNWADVPKLMERAEADGLPIVLMINFLVGLVTGFQAALQLKQVGANIFVADLEGGPFLRERIVWRTSSVEYGLYEQRRWRELPATYVERALTTAFEDAPGVRLSDDSLAPALRVAVVSFDGVRLLDQTFTAERPIEDADPAAMARAMGRALDEVARQVSAAVGSFAKARK